MFYDLLREMRGTDCNVLCTTIDSPAGEHCLFVNGEVAGMTENFPLVGSPGEKWQKGVYVIQKNNVRMLCEVLGIRQRVVICGGGHVAQALLKILKILGLETVVLEDRTLYGELARRNGADQVLIGPYRQSLKKLEDGMDTSFVIMTRGHQFDVECLYEILNREFAYAGLMSSRARVVTIQDLMRNRGITEEKLSRLHAPIGFKIGAETPEEIAVSVAAELIEAVHKVGNRSISPEIVEAMLERKPRVVAEIMTRKGPAPRLPGTRMVIFMDGRRVGTVGGGYLEAAAIQRAEELLIVNGRPEIMTVELNSETVPGEEGMACGGVVEVLLEPLYPLEEDPECEDAIHS